MYKWRWFKIYIFFKIKLRKWFHTAWVFSLNRNFLFCKNELIKNSYSGYWPMNVYYFCGTKFAVNEKNSGCKLQRLFCILMMQFFNVHFKSLNNAETTSHCDLTGIYSVNYTININLQIRKLYVLLTIFDIFFLRSNIFEIFPCYPALNIGVA